MKAALVVAVVLACACQEPPEAGPLPCKTAASCPSGYHCSPQGWCKGDIACLGDADCCLGERCEDQKCRARQQCSALAPCPDQATQCLQGLCVPVACSDTCPGQGATCLWGRCVRHTPCGGHCGADAACSVLTDLCITLRSAHGPCPDGQLRVLDDADRLVEGCWTKPEQTSCKPLPPLPEGERGVPGVLVRLGNDLGHVSYDRTYGDVVLARHDAKPPFALQAVEVLAGLPVKPVVVGAITGPRAGIAEPGPDVGEALDAATDKSGRLVVAYRDRTNQALRWLDRPAGTDGLVAQELDVGTAMAVALRPDGRPVILAFTPARPGIPSQLRLHAAQVPSPAGDKDWNAQDLDSEPLPAAPTPCAGPCPSGQACVQAGQKDQCLSEDAGCGVCLPSLVCHGGKCLTRRLPPPELEGVPQGRGTWLDLAVTQDGIVVAVAYSPTEGNLAIYRGKPGQPFQRTVVDGKALGSQDIGRFASLAIDDDHRAVIACADHQRGRLLLVRETGKTVAVTVLDDGVRKDGQHRVGADAMVWLTEQGALLVSHQDTRRGDLLLTQVPTTGTPSRVTLATADAAGFASSLVPLTDLTVPGKDAHFAVAATTWKLRVDGTLQGRVSISEVVWNGK